MTESCVDLALAGEGFDVFCPVCGTPMVENDLLATEYCKHVIFVHIDVTGHDADELDYVAALYAEVATKAKEAYVVALEAEKETPNAECLTLGNCFLQLLRSHSRRPGPSSILIFSMTQRLETDRATIYVAVDFEPPAA